MNKGPYGISSQISQQPLTIFVSAASQSVAGSLVSSVQQAFDMLPSITAGAVSIRLIGQTSAGGTLSNKMVLAPFEIRGNTSNRGTNGCGSLVFNNVQGRTKLLTCAIATQVNGNAVVYEYCGGHHHVENIISEMPTPAEPIDYSAGGNIDQGRGVMALWGSQVSVYSSRFSGRRYALRASYGGATLECRDCTGDKNSIGVGARFGGLVTVHGSSPWGFNRTASMSGGIVSDEGLIIAGNSASGGAK